MSATSPRAPDISVLVCTYNRCADLRELLSCALAQETGGEFAFEVLVVDNNSTDDTRRVVEELIAAGHSHVRYLFEGRQGKSHALNTGLAAARAPLYTIADDDFILPPDWLRLIHRAFRAHPEASAVSGKVLPLWQSEPPAWLTPEHWSAIAMADYGEEEFYADEGEPVCLLVCSFRRADVLSVGGYRAELGVTAGRPGGVEDLDILQRLWKAGRRALYQPQISFRHKVTPDRLTKRYHRRWHEGHGRFYAALRDAEVERAAVRLFDVPAHMYRAAAGDALRWLKSRLSGRADEAFWHETRLCFFAGFFRQRRADYLAVRPGGTARELYIFARALAAGRGVPKGAG